MGHDEVHSRIEALEAELRRLKADVGGPVQQGASRRDLIKKVAIAGAGAAAGAVAIGSIRPAGATTGNALVLGQLQTADAITYIQNGGTAPDQAGTPLTTEKTMFWVDNRTSTLDNGYGVRGDGHGVNGVGVHGNSDFSGIGVLGSGGIGVQAIGTRAGAQLTPTGTPPATRTDAHTKGELVEDTNGDLWLCVADGTPGTWRSVGGPTSAGQLHLLPGPVRVYDSRPGGNADGPLAGGSQRVVSLAVPTTTPAVPPGATGAMISLTLDATVQSGFLAVFANGIAWPNNSSINWYANGQIVAVTTVTAVDATSKVSVLAGGPGSTQFIIDVIGYFR